MNWLFCQYKSYKPGEKANYTIQYGVISSGIGSLEVKSDTLNGRSVWHAKFSARTTGLADAIFKVIDIYEVYIDPATELPVKSIRNIHEGRYRKYNEVLFDHKTRSDSAILTSDLTGQHIAPKGIHDIVSCFYFFRNNILPDGGKLKKGDMIELNTWFTDQLYPIRLRFVGMEDVKIKGGKIKCYKFNPVTEVGRLFKTEEDVSFWFSADNNFLPVKIRFNIFVGAFLVELANYDGLVSPLGIKKK
ncbi:MAG: DUF3108 domain-containing protein [Bacteroidales bacterium]|nr:DUF3108 domain-containing protein [Bacteroidales bacterium]